MAQTLGIGLHPSPFLAAGGLIPTDLAFSESGGNDASRNPALSQNVNSPLGPFAYKARHEDGHSRRRPRDATFRGDRGPPQAHGRDRRPADPLAYHEDLFSLRDLRFRDLPRLQGLH